MYIILFALAADQPVHGASPFQEWRFWIQSLHSNRELCYMHKLKGNLHLVSKNMISYTFQKFLAPPNQRNPFVRYEYLMF